MSTRLGSMFNIYGDFFKFFSRHFKSNFPELNPELKAKDDNRKHSNKIIFLSHTIRRKEGIHLKILW